MSHHDLMLIIIIWETDMRITCYQTVDWCNYAKSMRARMIQPNGLRINQHDLYSLLTHAVMKLVYLPLIEISAAIVVYISKQSRN